jgi:hypothetical protein
MLGRTIGAMFSDRAQADIAVDQLRAKKFREVWLGVAVYVEENTSFGEFIWLCFADLNDTCSNVLRMKGLDEAQIAAFGPGLTEGKAIVTVSVAGRAAEAAAIMRGAGGDLGVAP